MNKNEFLEILQDYLKKYFSQDEINDILRDYEEYFVDGIIEGKTEEEIIKSLGSPKAIVRELVEDIDLSNKENTAKKDLLYDKVNVAKVKAKEGYKKTKENLNNYLTPDLLEGKGLPNWAIKLTLFILTALLIIPGVAFFIAMIGVGISTITFTLGILAVGGIGLASFNLDLSVGFMFIFLAIGLLGINIILWYVYITILNIGNSTIKSYKNWLRKRKIYISAKDRIEENKKKNEDTEGTKEEGNYEEEDGDKDE